MRIASIGPVPPLRGGISHYNTSLIQELKRKGHDVLPVSFEKLYPKFLFPGESEKDESKPLVNSRAVLVAWNPISWFRAVRAIRKFKAKKVIVHLWHPFFVPALVAVLRLSGVKDVVVVAHNVLPHEKETLGRIFNPVLFKMAKKIIVGASAEQRKLESLVPAASSFVIPHPIYDRFGGCVDAGKQVQIREEMGISQEDVLFAHVGLVRKYKGVDLLLNAFSKLENPAASLCVAGEFYDDIAPYEAVAKAAPNGERIEIRNEYLSDVDMYKIIGAADCVVLPYRSGTQSGVAMVALALGVPVIASRVGALADVVNEGNGLLLEPGNVDDIKKAMETFIQLTKEEWRSRRKTIAEDAAQKYSWSHLAEVVVGEVNE